MNKNKTAMTIAAVLTAGLVLGAVILRNNKPHGEADGHGHAEESAHAAEPAPKAEANQKGPHGGRLFGQDGFGLELSIFEKGVEPEFRAYLYRDGKPVAPAQADVSVTLQRLGLPPQDFRFKAAGDFLRGEGVVTEPHSFAATVHVKTTGQRYEFRFEQIEDRVTMTDEQLRHNGVTVATSGPARIASMLQLQGEVQLNQDRAVVVTPRMAGVVEGVRVSAGDHVRRGQVLAVISSPALADQRSELLAAQKRLALARTSHDREKRLWEDKISAEQDYLGARHAMQEADIAVEAARQKLAALGASATDSTQGLTRLEIRAPIDGVVVDKKISVGESLKDDAPIFQLADLASVWIELTVPSSALGQVQVGMQAEVKATALDAQGEARLSYVGALVGEQTRSATARLVLPNPKGVWRPGLPVTVALRAQATEVPVAVDADAVQTLRGASVVFGRYGEQFESRPLTLGRTDGRYVEVLGGLKAGERYASRNSFLVKADIGKAAAEHDH